MKPAALLSVLFAGGAFGAALTSSVTSQSSTPSSTKKSACSKKSTAATTTSTSATSASTSAKPSTSSPLQTACNADNCARAVTGTVQGAATQSAHKSDCSSFLQCTAYPATSTVTTTSTVFPVTKTVTVYPSTVTDITTVTTVTDVDATETEIDVVTQISLQPVFFTEPESVLTATVVANERRNVRVVGPITTESSFTSVELISSLTTTLVGIVEAVYTITTDVPEVTSASTAATSAGSSNVVCPSSVPTYASACSGTARFSSACSCWGIAKRTTTMTTPVTTVTVTATGQTTQTVSASTTIVESVAATTTVTDYTTLATTVVDVIQFPSTVQETTIVTVVPPVATGSAYCENGQSVNGLSPSCTAVGCSTTNLRIEGASDTVYEGTILSGPRNITTASGGTHLCDGTNDGANPTPFANGISTIDAAAGLCGFTYDGTFDSEFDDFFIERIGNSNSVSSGDEFWGILVNYAFTAAGGCETEVHPTDELLWAFNAFNVNFFLRVQPTQTPVVLAPGQSTTFTVQGTDGEGDTFQNIAGALFNGQTSDSNGNVPFTAPTTPGTYKYKATRSDSIRSNAVTVVVQG